jgi:hypothetical protein
MLSLTNILGFWQIGFVLLLVQELVTGKGFLGSLGILDQIYKVLPK